MGKRTTTATATTTVNNMSSDAEQVIDGGVEDVVDSGPEVSEQVTTVDTVTDLINRIEQIQNTFKIEIKTVLSDLKAVRKVVSKLEKKKNRKRTVDPNKPRAPSGITRPTAVSEDLRTFLGLAEGELIPRTEVTKRISAYIIENNMKNPEDGRKINLDGPAGEKLRLLLNPDKPLGFFNLQTYLKVHFLKNTDSVPAAAPTSEAPKESPAVDTTTTKARTARRVRKTRKDLEAAT